MKMGDDVVTALSEAVTTRRGVFRNAATAIAVLASGDITAFAKKDSGKGKPADKRQGRNDVNTEIIGGTKARRKYPIVSLQDLRRGKGKRDRHTCGGTLMSDRRHVVFAAHCAFDVRDNPKHFRILAGCNNLKNKSCRSLGIERVDIYPWDENTFAGDVAVIRLKSQAPSTMPTAQLPGDESFEVAGTPLVTVGWGVTDPGQRLGAKKLREVTVHVVSDQKCAEAFRQVNAPVISEAQMCAADPGKDACFGDSGGGLYGVRNGRFVLVGITSWGILCAHSMFPGVYTRVSTYTGFVQQRMSGRRNA